MAAGVTKRVFPVPPGTEKKPIGFCAWCGKQIGAGWFCTAVHYNLYVQRFAAQPQTRRGSDRNGLRR